MEINKFRVSERAAKRRFTNPKKSSDESDNDADNTKRDKPYFTSGNHLIKIIYN